MATIKVYARGIDLVTRPGYRAVVGNLPRYVGRKAKMIETEKGTVASYPATEDGEEYNVGSKEAREIARRVKQGSLWPADVGTAQFCGVKFAKIEYTNGAWAPASVATADKSKPGKGGGKVSST